MNCLDEGFEDAMTVMLFPLNMRRELRTSNHIERLNKELKRRSKVIGIFPNQDSLIRLIGAVLFERNDQIKVMPHKAFHKPALDQVKKIAFKLEQRAKEQQAFMVA